MSSDWKKSHISNPKPLKNKQKDEDGIVVFMSISLLLFSLSITFIIFLELFY